MSDQITLHRHDLPWLPSESTEVAVLHEHDMPLIGVVGQHGAVYLYRCIVGMLDSWNFWLYVRVPDEDQETLLSSSGDELDEVITRLSQAPGVVAAAGESGLIVWVESGTDAEVRLWQALRDEVTRLEADLRDAQMVSSNDQLVGC